MRAAEVDDAAQALLAAWDAAREQAMPRLVQAVVENVDMADDTRLARLLKFILVQSPSYSLRGGTPEVLRGIIARGLGLR